MTVQQQDDRDDPNEILTSDPSNGGEIVEETPRAGTLVWLELQEHVELQGYELPRMHRVPEDATLVERDGKYCAVVSAAGERCQARPTRRYGVCLAHAGGGGMVDSEQAARMAKRSHASRAIVRQRQQILAAGLKDPRHVARALALERATDVAEALLAPLDDAEMGSAARQRAAVTILDATFPLATASIEVQLPSDEAGVQAMGWQQLQQLAASLGVTAGDSVVEIPAAEPV